jgi:hypothetical protein
VTDWPNFQAKRTKMNWIRKVMLVMTKNDRLNQDMMTKKIFIGEEMTCTTRRLNSLDEERDYIGACVILSREFRGCLFAFVL